MTFVGLAQQSQGYFRSVAEQGLAHEVALLIADRNNGTAGDATRVVYIAAVDPKMTLANAIRAALIDCNLIIDGYPDWELHSVPSWGPNGTSTSRPLIRDYEIQAGLRVIYERCLFKCPLGVNAQGNRASLSCYFRTSSLWQ